MITKARIEETIRGVIQEFKQKERIPGSAADDLAVALTDEMTELLEQEETFSHRQVDDTLAYVNRVRDEAQSESAADFLQEILTWQKAHCS